MTMRQKWEELERLPELIAAIERLVGIEEEVLAHTTALLALQHKGSVNGILWAGSLNLSAQGSVDIELPVPFAACYVHNGSTTVNLLVAADDTSHSTSVPVGLGRFQVGKSSGARRSLLGRSISLTTSTGAGDPGPFYLAVSSESWMPADYPAANG